jgi:eukaryotic-like serine/threonine-protein kinase
VLEDSVARSTATFGPDDDKIVRCQTSLAQGYDIAEKPAEASQLWKTLYNRTKVKQGIEHHETQELADRLAAAYEKAGRFEEALRQREESLKIKRKQNRSPVNDLLIIARLYEELHDYKRAEALWREIIAGIHNDEDLLSSVKASLGQCLLRCGKPADAEQVLRECLALRERRNPWEAVRIKSFLGRALLAQKEYADAEPLLLAGYEGLKILEGRVDPPYAGGPSPEDKACWLENLEQLVQLYEATGKKDNADAWRKKVQEAKNAAKMPAKP